MGSLVTSVEDGICVARIDRPDRLNALDDAVMDALLATLATVDADPS